MNELDIQFLVVVPNKSSIISDCPEIESHVYKTIIAQPGPQLLQDIHEITDKHTISGIITRGSLSQYLYANRVPYPIFNLDYSLINIFDLLQSICDQGYRKICIFEMACNTDNIDVNNITSEIEINHIKYYYYKMYDNTRIEETIKQLISDHKIDCLVGDVEPVYFAQKYGISSFIFRIDAMDYKRTIARASYTSLMAASAQSKSDFIEIITHIIKEPLIIFKEDGTLFQSNQKAQILLSNDKKQLIQDLLNLSIDEIKSLPANYIMELFGQQTVLNIVPVILLNEQMYAMIFNSTDNVEELALSIRKKNNDRGLTAKNRFDTMICEDPLMKNVIATAEKYAKSNGTVIIYGETGTGKEVLASSIHNASVRKHGPFVAINCATFTESLIESELFGYEKGSFTGALKNGKEGLFELAHCGTIFLDEIGELPLPVQAKLLRVLQEKEVRRIGGDRIIPVDVRIIAATNRDLKKMVQEGTFREDLYYRLALLEITIPPLRKRSKDIIPLLTSFLHHFSELENKSVFWTDDSIFETTLNYDWPGNVRELRNFAEKAIILCENYKLTNDFISDLMLSKHPTKPLHIFQAEITNNLNDLDSKYLQFLLEYFNNDREKLASYMNLSRTTLWRKLSGKTPN